MKSDGWRVGPREILEKLEDPAVSDEVDPKSYSFRLYVHMETGDPRYLHLNTGMWIGSGVRRGTEGRLIHIFFGSLDADPFHSRLRCLPRLLIVSMDVEFRSCLDTPCNGAQQFEKGAPEGLAHGFSEGVGVSRLRL